MSLNLFAPIRNGPNFTSQKKNSGSFCANGDLAVSGKNRAPLLPEAQMAMFKTGSMQWGHGRLKKLMGKQQNMYEILFHTAEKTQYDTIVNEVIQKKYDEF